MSAMCTPETGDQPLFAAAVLATWSGGAWDGMPAAPLAGITNDTRTLRPGQLYVALEGAHLDGHAFVAEAARRGAGGALVRTDWQPSAATGLPLLRVADPQRALTALASAHRHAVGARIVGVTGSAGKTTVKEWTALVLGAAGPTARTLGNYNNHVGLPLSLLAMRVGTASGVFEIGTNHPGEIAPLAALLKPQWGLVTNVGASHIEHFGSVGAIAAEKACLLQALPADGLAFLNADGEWFDNLASASAAPVVTVAVHREADYQLIARRPARREVVIRERATGIQVTLVLPGAAEFQALNALFAVAVGRRAGLAPEAIAAALLCSAEVPMRWQRDRVREVVVVNDAYNANPLSMAAALSAFAEEPAAGGHWLVLGGMLELGERAQAEHLALGRRIAGGAWAGLITVGPLGAWLAAGAGEAGMPASRIFACADVDDAARRLAALVVAGDAVLFKASRGVRLEDVLSRWRAGQTA